MAPLNNGSSTAQAAPEVRYQNPIFPIGNKARDRKSDSFETTIFSGANCGKLQRLMLRGLKSSRFGFSRLSSFFRTVQPYPTKREYRKIIDLKVSAGSWYVRSEVSKIPAVSGQKRQGNKKQGKLVQVFLEFCGFGFKCIPPQRHLHPFRVECWGSSERIWSWKLHQPWRNPLTFHPKTSNKDCITTTPPLVNQNISQQSQSPIPLQVFHPPPFSPGYQCQVLITLIFQLHCTCPDRTKRPKTSLPNLGDTTHRSETLSEAWFFNGIYIYIDSKWCNILLNIYRLCLDFRYCNTWKKHGLLTWVTSTFWIKVFFPM